MKPESWKAQRELDRLIKALGQLRHGMREKFRNSPGVLTGVLHAELNEMIRAAQAEHCFPHRWSEGIITYRDCLLDLCQDIQKKGEEE